MKQSTRNPFLHPRPHHDDAEARVASRPQPGKRGREENRREFIKAGAIIGAMILALRLYAAIAPPSPW